ncbi:MAG TPA: hypothetical protein VL335_00290 [Candidatus Paceibacterota bacterium]|jgi:hypothetical protein|nr:hypothetical protein [Candidatus Paceibacterota bacterium]
MKNSLIKKVVLGTMMFIVILGTLNIQPKQTHAQWAVFDVVTETNTTFDRIRTWVLDGLAWHIAKMLVQRITASVVQWINSGFSGSPSFLTNPGGFFADLGDQVTGSFIANTGILSGLCSPFNIDVRLSLALGQAGYGQVEKYTCTLSSVIRNAKNSTINGATIEGFTKGDFKQGGWPAFIEISRPSNNASGAYLKAHSDLLQRIGSKQGAQSQQLLQGGGFLSWDSCKNIDDNTASMAVADTGNDQAISSFVSASDLSDKTQYELAHGGTVDKSSPQQFKYATGDGTSIQSKIDPKTGELSYQDCHTETPGSVIEGQLNHILPSGADALNLADSINEIVDALMGQLVNKVLETGLAAVSSHSSGGTASIIQQLTDSTNSTSTFAQDAQNIRNEFGPYIKNAQIVIGYRQDAVDAFNSPKEDYAAAQTCFQGLLNSTNSSVDKSTVQSALNGIASDLNNMAADEKSYDDSLADATKSLALVTSSADTTSAVSSPEDLQKASAALTQLVSSQSATIDTQGLKSNVSVATSIAKNYDTKAKAFYSQCRSLGGN